eukprot:1160088-Pelagomonas_calceolata.AAC.8
MQHDLGARPGAYGSACQPTLATTAGPQSSNAVRLHLCACSATLERGQKQLNDMLAKLAGSKKEGGAAPVLAGPDAFLLYDSFGFPLELTQEMAEQQGIQVRPLLYL